ncbi:unnamed protein product [Eruca vesicaria subsp. sativa]|uniref:Uncharacterized protein n=1 Tax=Eruca vesicaria subsp. sativa TaxID=29727 RepID=A0ABC8J9P9_ERUVS|nr:unnamed protein product [Eruca vesicaria subsp. sativa]
MYVNHVKVEKGRPRKRACTEARTDYASGPFIASTPASGSSVRKKRAKSLKALEKVMTDGFGQCLKDMKAFGDRMDAVEKVVGITKKATASNDLQLTLPDSPERRPDLRSESVMGAKAGSGKNIQDDVQDPKEKESSSKELNEIESSSKELNENENSSKELKKNKNSSKRAECCLPSDYEDVQATGITTSEGA